VNLHSIVASLFAAAPARFVPSSGRARAGTDTLPLDGTSILLVGRAPRRLPDADEIEIACDAGAVWVTRMDDEADVVVEAGGRHVALRPRGLVVQSLTEVTVFRVSATHRIDGPVHGRDARPGLAALHAEAGTRLSTAL
jgi:hypothetical protein